MNDRLVNYFEKKKSNGTDNKAIEYYHIRCIILFYFIYKHRLLIMQVDLKIFMFIIKVHAKFY